MIITSVSYEFNASFGIHIPVYYGGIATPVTTNTATYAIKIDWDGDGDFSEAGEDVTADVKYIRFSRGRDNERGIAQTGQCEIRLNNATGTYTPSLHPATVLPKRLMQITTTTGGSSTLFTGYLEDITPHPHWEEQDCYITAVDGMDYLSRCKVNVPFHTSEHPNHLLGAVLDEADCTYARSLDAPDTHIAYCYTDRNEAKNTMDKLSGSMGGWCYIDRNGYFVAESVDHRTSHTSKYTFNDSMIQILYTLNSKDVYNVIQVPQGYVVDGDYQPSTTIYPPPYCPNGATTDVWVMFNKPSKIMNLTCVGQSPSADFYIMTHYTVDTYLTAANIHLANYSGVDDQLSALNVQTIEILLNDSSSEVSDPTSKLAYQPRTYSLDAYPLVKADADTLAATLLAKYKDPKAAIAMTIINKNAELLGQILGLDISDRVTIVNTELGIDADYYIEHIEHTIDTGGKKHTATYTLSPV